MSNDYRPQHRALTNSRLICSLPGCGRRRFFISVLCYHHSQRRRMWGHPLARYIEKKELLPYRKLAREFLRLALSPRPENAAICEATQAALEVVEQLLKPPAHEPRGRPLHMNPYWLLHREQVRLAEAKVTAREALEVIMAVYLKVAYEPNILPNDGKCLTYAIASHVFRLRKLYASEVWDQKAQRSVRRDCREPGSLALNLLGSRIRQHLGVYLMHVLDYFLDQERKQQEKARCLEPAVRHFQHHTGSRPQPARNPHGQGE